MTCLENKVLLLWTAQNGYVVRNDGLLDYLRTGFNLTSATYDLDGSDVEAIQPRLVGGIAPNSKPAASNQSGESRSFSHTSITVSGTYTTVKMMDTGGKYEFTYTEVTSGTLSTVTWTGNLRMYMIYSGTLSAAERTSLEASLYGLYPEIESVDIGTQTWATRNFEAVATPMGNVIANVTENVNLEKVSGWDFTAGFIAFSASIVDSNTFTSTSAGGVRKIGVFVANKNYKIRLAGSISAGNFYIASTTTGGALQGCPNLSGTFDQTFYIKSGIETTLYLRNNQAATTNITVMSIEEVGWAGAANLYDFIYAATSGTAEEKEYAALKEAAAWAYHTNSVDLGAIYGKLYNGYGKDLLVDDIALQADWGYHVATEAELTTLATNGGYALKYAGTDYWTTTGGTNTTGFTALGGGTRSDVDGSFSTIKDTTAFWCADSDKVLLLNHADNTATITAVDKAYGAYVRLVED